MSTEAQTLGKDTKAWRRLKEQPVYKQMLNLLRRGGDTNEELALYNAFVRGMGVAQAELERAHEALRWYADPANWRARGHQQIDADTIPADRDRGIRARAVFILEPLGEPPVPLLEEVPDAPQA